MSARSLFAAPRNRRDLLKASAALGMETALGLPRLQGRAAQASGKLIVASFYPTNEASGWSGLISAFNEVYPDVDVEVQVTSGDEYLAKILSQQSSGTLPDVIAVENSSFPRFAEAGLLLSLDDRLAATTDFTKEDFPARLVDRFSWEGQLYGIPYDVQPIAGVFLNKAIFAEAGVDLPSSDWTWDDFMGLAEALTVKDGDRTSRYGLDPGGQWANWIYAFGGALVDNPQVPTVVTTDTPEAIAGMQAYLDLSMVQGVSPKREMFAGGGVQSGDLFAAGQTAMFHGGYWELVSYPGRWDGMDLGYIQIPAGPAGVTGFSTGGTCYSVSTGSQMPDIAFDFVKFFMGMEGWKAAAAATDLIYPPAYIPAFNEIFMAVPDEPIENKGLNGTAAEFAIFSPADPSWSEWSSTIINPDLDMMAAGSLSVTDALTKWATDFTPKLAANQ